MAEIQGYEISIDFTSSGSTTKAQDAEKIQTSVVTILMTRLGTRFMEPTFGSNIPYLMMEPNDPILEEKVSQEVKDALTTWEPRVTVEEVATIRTDTMIALVIRYYINPLDVSEALQLEFEIQGVL